MSEITELEMEKTVEVFPQDLEDIRGTLVSVYHYCLAQDLCEQYKSLRKAAQPSPLTKEIKKMHERISAMILDTQEDEEEPIG